MKSIEHFIDLIPRDYRNKVLHDLKIIDFELYHLVHFCNRYDVPIYILTDLVLDTDFDMCYETMIKIGNDDIYSNFLSVQERCYSKLQAYKQHKSIYKKLLNGFYDNEILDLISRKEAKVMNFTCP